MKTMKEEVIYDDEVFRYIAKRVLEMGKVTQDILNLLSKEGELYHDNILKKLSYSDSLLRPAIMALYASGFIDRSKEGNMKYYSLNENGKRLLNYEGG